MGVNTWLMKGFFDTIPTELDESARVDGATPAQIFWGVVLPLAAPVLAVVGADLVRLHAERVRDRQRRCCRRRTTSRCRSGMRGFIDQQYGQHWGPFAAGALLAAIPVVLLFLFLQRYIVGGLTAGLGQGMSARRSASARRACSTSRTTTARSSTCSSGRTSSATRRSSACACRAARRRRACSSATSATASRAAPRRSSTRRPRPRRGGARRFPVVEPGHALPLAARGRRRRLRAG